MGYSDVEPCHENEYMESVENNNVSNSTENLRTLKNSKHKNNIIYTKYFNGVMYRKYKEQCLGDTPTLKPFLFKNSRMKTQCNVSLYKLCQETCSDSNSENDSYTTFVTFNNNHTVSLDDLISGLVEVRTFMHKKGDLSFPVTCVTYRLYDPSTETYSYNSGTSSNSNGSNSYNFQKLYLNNVDMTLFNTMLHVLESVTFD